MDRKFCGAEIMEATRAGNLGQLAVALERAKLCELAPMDRKFCGAEIMEATRAGNLGQLAVALERAKLCELPEIEAVEAVEKGLGKPDGKARAVFSSYSALPCCVL